MKSLHIDFAAPRTPMRWWRLAVLGGVLCVSAAVMHWRVAADEALLAGAEAPEAIEVAPELDDAKRQRLNEALNHLGFEWPQALSHLEAAMVPGTSLVSADWRLPAREVKLLVEARSTADMLNFVDALKRDAWLQGLKLTRQEAAREGVGFAMEGRLPEVAP